MGAANQSGEDNRDVARMGAASRGSPGGRARRHRQPPLRLRSRGGEPGIACPAPRRGPASNLAGGRRVDEPRPMGLAQTGGRPTAWRADPLRHHARLADDQPEDVGALFDRVDGARRARTSPRSTASRARIRTASRYRATRRAIAAQEEGRFDDQIVPVDVPPKSRRDEPTTMTVDEGPRSDTYTGEAREAPARLPRRREPSPPAIPPTLNDGAACLVLANEETREGARPRAARTHRLDRGRRRRSRVHGNRTDGCHP